MEKYLRKQIDNVKQQVVFEAIKKFISAIETGRENFQEIFLEKQALVTTQEEELHKEAESLVRHRKENAWKLIQAKEENQKLKEQLFAAQQQLSEISDKYISGRSEARKQERKRRFCAKETAQDFREIFTKHILLRNAVEKLEKERNEVKKQHMLDVIDLKKKNAAKELLLNKKIAELSHMLERNSPMATADIMSRSRDRIGTTLGLKPGLHPVLKPGLKPGLHPVLKPGLKPGLHPVLKPGLKPGLHPVLKPGLKPGLHPVLKPGLKPGLKPVLKPGLKPGLHPGLKPGLKPGLHPVQKQELKSVLKSGLTGFSL
ncbi:transcriptional regulatory protein AlgP-like [Boleophthalmus pectinirostris]|uniref:transcriptional regulatory protein AlgP-like n=1 Tax=Boleophthalmus pectinirostris TaxID=150288 RepID=UPI00242EF07C|nr:transcriptional regulatory protein AlgP-like [Boleophthalmus pectinirostris]